MYRIPNHLQVFEGDLYDNREYSVIIRKRYCFSFRHITNVSQLKATLRNGKYAWPGGYPMYFLCCNGGCLSFDTVRKEFHNIVDSMRRNIKDGWYIVGCDINYEDNQMYDAHTNEKIECAYGR